MIVYQRGYDRWLMIVTILLIGFGALMVYSSTSVVTPAFAKRNISEFFYFKRHLFTLFIGTAALFLAARTNPDTLSRFAIPLLVFSFLLMLLVFVPKIGVSAGGARRWIRLWPSTFQPSELVKLAMVIFMARYLASEKYEPNRFTFFLVPVAVMGVFQFVFLWQPDFGAAMSLGLITMGLLTLAGVRLRYLLSIAVLAVPVLVKLLMEPYRFRRVLSFLDPWKDPQGGSFQLVQSFIALGSGGLTGIGLGESRQKLSFLPESHTDFIFSLIGEELGFIGASVVVVLFLLLFLRGVQIANRTKDPFGYYLASGLSMMIALQAVINFFVATGLAPTKGLPLPFISYGGSSLLVNMAAIGILLNLSRGFERRRVTDKNSALIERKKALMAVYGRTRSWPASGGAGRPGREARA